MLAALESTAQKVDAYFRCLDPWLHSQRFEVRLFGSHARGHAFAFSDIDVAVISDIFQGMPWNKRLELLKPKGVRGQRISALGITFHEFKSHRYPSVIRTIRGPHSTIVLAGGASS
jgi:predicted nucleotidyltransferase